MVFLPGQMPVRDLMGLTLTTKRWWWTCQVPTSSQTPHCCGGREVTCPNAAQLGPNREVPETAQGQSLNATRSRKGPLTSGRFFQNWDLAVSFLGAKVHDSVWFTKTHARTHGRPRCAWTCPERPCGRSNPQAHAAQLTRASVERRPKDAPRAALGRRRVANTHVFSEALSQEVRRSFAGSQTPSTGLSR